MIEPQLVEQVERLLAEGKLSYRKISRFTGVSRGTIGAIALGQTAHSTRTDVAVGRGAHGSRCSAAAMSAVRGHGVYALPVVPDEKRNGQIAG